MVHYPSLLVGSSIAGISFLALHQQLSHRERLTYRWKLQEYAEQKLTDMWNEIRKSRGINDRNLIQVQRVPSLTKLWNDGLSMLQDALRRDEK